MENPIKMDDLGVPVFLETPIYILSITGCFSTIYDFGPRFLAQPALLIWASFVLGPCGPRIFLEVGDGQPLPRPVGIFKNTAICGVFHL